MTTLAQLRRFAVARTLFRPTTIAAAVQRLGFVQADPIRAPARAQDLVLRHRVRGYRAGDLETAYPTLDLDEDLFINYGFLPSSTYRLSHPRVRRSWNPDHDVLAPPVLAFIAKRGVVHPREVDAEFRHGKVTNWFGGTSNASTQLLDALHDRGLLRVAGRVGGIRTYELARRPEPSCPPDPDGTLDLLVDVLVGLYAPLPAAGLRTLVSMLRACAPQWADRRRAAFARARDRLATASVAGVDWFWPQGEDPADRRWSPRPVVRLLAPFDPIVWDRVRFALLWGWHYRFEAYTPAAHRVRGYYALPLLWRDDVVGWANLSVRDGRLLADCGYVAGHPPHDPRFSPALVAEMDSMATFLGLPPA